MAKSTAQQDNLLSFERMFKMAGNAWVLVDIFNTLPRERLGQVRLGIHALGKL